MIWITSIYYILNALCTLSITLWQTKEYVVCRSTGKETEAQKDKYIPKGQKTVKKENQKVSSDWSDPGVV